MKNGMAVSSVNSCYLICCLMQSNVCKHLSDSRQDHLFASAQCLGYSFEFGQLNDELCFPSKNTILNQVKRAVERLGAVAVFVASDHDAMIGDFEKTLKSTVRCQLLMIFCSSASAGSFVG